MIDTTKTANQKRREAAAARRNEKAQQKAAKVCAKTGQVQNGAMQQEMSEGLPNGNKLDQSLADDSGMLHPGTVTNNENSQTILLEPRTRTAK